MKIDAFLTMRVHHTKCMITTNKHIYIYTHTHIMHSASTQSGKSKAEVIDILKVWSNKV